MDFAGDLATHWTLAPDARRSPARIAEIAAKHGLKVTRIVLDRGTHASQPMLSRRRKGTLRFELADAQAMAMRLGNEGLGVTRVKIEASVTNADVPLTDEAAEPSRYFEHHVRVRHDARDELRSLRAIAEAHDAHLSRSAGADDGDGAHERFVTQRCYGAGLPTARAKLDALLAALSAGGVAVVDAQQELVVYDSNVGLDAGWMDPPRKAVNPDRYPNAFRLHARGGAPRTELFDPALKHFRNAFKDGGPAFADAAQAKAWKAMRRRALDHVLRAVAGSRWSELLVLRGSVLLETWLGAAAREPGDLDWVVDPPSLTATCEDAVDMLRAIVEVVRDAKGDSGLHVSAADVAIDAIWTYERAEGRRLVFPWTADGMPSGNVQLDFVFEEPLAIPPRRADVVSAFGPSISVRAATPELSLAWKLLWLATDMHPQGKDLYDATLLAEKFPLSRALLDEVLRAADESAAFEAETPMVWNVEWQHFVAEYPEIEGTEIEWKTRLSKALARSLRAR